MGCCTQANPKDKTNSNEKIDMPLKEVGIK